MTNLSSLPLTQFDPRFKALLQKGCTEYVEVPFPDRKAALHFRNVLTTYRARLRKYFPDNPGAWEALYGTIISTRERFVTLRPRFSEFDPVFNRLEIEFPKLDHDPLEDILREQAEANDNKEKE